MVVAGKNIKKRFLLLIGIMTIGLLILVVRLFWIQIVQNDWYQKMAYEHQTRDSVISPRRGDITDRNGNKLAVSATVFTVLANCKEIKKEDRDAYAQKLSELLSMDKGDILKIFEKNSSYEIVKRKIETEISDSVRKWVSDAKVKGIDLIEDTKRYYPNNNLASHIIGFTNVDGVGISGIETIMESSLRGIPGRILSEVDASNKEIPSGNEQYIEPQEGLNVVLTIDESLQYFAENALKKAIVDNNVLNGGAVLITDPRNGDILAMASYPDFDLNNPYAAPPGTDAATWNGRTAADVKILSNGVWRNKAVNDTYEPGSTFKAVTTSAGIEEGVITPDDKVTDAPVPIPGGRFINCWKSPIHGLETFRVAVYNSCNPVFVRLAQKLGGDDVNKSIKTFYEYVRNFGFFDKTGITLPGESNSIIQAKPTELDMMTAAFGQSFTITPIQLISAYGAIANGGTLYKPRIVKELTDKDGNVVKKFEPEAKRQVISQQTSDTVKEILRGVVAYGTGKNGYVEGYRVAGKTGTSETVESRLGSNRKIASFCSFAPADNPVLCVLVMLDFPSGPFGQMGGGIAAPVAKTIYQDALTYLDIEKKYSELDQQQLLQSVTVPNIKGMKVSDAQALLKKSFLGYIIEGENKNLDAIVMEQTPKKGASVSISSKVILYTYTPDSEVQVKVPDVVGKSIDNAADSLNWAGLNLSISGLGSAVSQNPAAGAMAPKGTIVQVEFMAPASD